MIKTISIMNEICIYGYYENKTQSRKTIIVILFALDLGILEKWPVTIGFLDHIVFLEYLNLLSRTVYYYYIFISY